MKATETTTPTTDIKARNAQRKADLAAKRQADAVARKTAIEAKRTAKQAAKQQAKQAKADLKASTPKKTGRLDEQAIRAKYPHAIEGTLAYDPTTQKQTIEAKLACGHTHRLATSDLFQVRVCSKACRKAMRIAEREERKAQTAKAA